MELANCRFGRLTALCRTHRGKRVAWVCVCDCGNRVTVAQVELRSGDTRSCGCLRREANINRNTTHGKTRSACYKKWRAMWNRVRATLQDANRCYIGVTVCESWRNFETFYADMGEPPTGYSLDRIDNTKGYNKHNCRWVSLAEQARNTRRLRLHNGVHMSELARRAGLSPDVVLERINKLGWDVDRALATPLRKQRKEPR